MRNLENVRVAIKEATDLDVAYAYDDLVFPEHAAFLIQFDDTNDRNYFCYFHQDCLAEAKTELFANLSIALNKQQSKLVSKGSFALNQKNDEIEIRFMNA